MHETADNHTNLHKIAVPPAYLTQAGLKYSQTATSTIKNGLKQAETMNQLGSKPLQTGINMTDYRQNYLAQAKERRTERYNNRTAALLPVKQHRASPDDEIRMKKEAYERALRMK